MPNRKVLEKGLWEADGRGGNTIEGLFSYDLHIL